jgi:hypothetical protein
MFSRRKIVKIHTGSIILLLVVVLSLLVVISGVSSVSALSSANPVSLITSGSHRTAIAICASHGLGPNFQYAERPDPNTPSALENCLARVGVNPD